MDTLISIRLKSFIYSASSVLGVALLGALVSEQFLSLIQEYTGTALWGTLISLVVAELMKHMRNRTIAKSDNLPVSSKSSSGKMYF